MKGNQFAMFALDAEEFAPYVEINPLQTLLMCVSYMACPSARSIVLLEGNDYRNVLGPDV